jgi:putative ABC transport system substrate-binding protein
VWRIAVLQVLAEKDPETIERHAAFEKALAELGWSKGRVQIDYRWAEGDVERVRKYAKELVGLTPDVILASGSIPVSRLLEETRIIPIVFAQVVDPVGAGFVDSMPRPAGNVTGFTQFDYSLSGKWLELLTRSIHEDRPFFQPIIAAATRYSVRRDRCELLLAVQRVEC